MRFLLLTLIVATGCVEAAAPSPSETPTVMVLFAAEPGDAGEVTMFPAQHEYEPGVSILAIAHAKPGFEFVEWNDGHREAERELTAQNDAVFVALFREAAPILTELTLDTFGPGTVHVSPNPPLIGKPVLLTATDTANHPFSHWSGDASGEHSVLKLIAEPTMHIVAHFTTRPQLIAPEVTEGPNIEMVVQHPNGIASWLLEELGNDSMFYVVESGSMNAPTISIPKDRGIYTFRVGVQESAGTVVYSDEVVVERLANRKLVVHNDLNHQVVSLTTTSLGYLHTNETYEHIQYTCGVNPKGIVPHETMEIDPLTSTGNYLLEVTLGGFVKKGWCWTGEANSCGISIATTTIHVHYQDPREIYLSEIFNVDELCSP